MTATMQTGTMRPAPVNRTRPRGRRVLTLAVGLASFAIGFAAPGQAEERKQKQYESANAAVAALVAALQAADKTAILDVLGPDGEPLVDSGDAVQDRKAFERFVKAYEQKHALVPDGDAGDAMELHLGDDDWPFPIPVVKAEGGWRFDSLAGQDELLSRRIGRNELSAIQVCLAYVDAQREYYALQPEGEPLRFAQRIASTEGKRDGLFWEAKDDALESPLGPAVARARAEGYALEGRGEPFHGYYYRILTAQGPEARGGAYDYVVRGKMIGGFALVAFPAEYGESGVMTFLVNHDGVVFQKDLGADTKKIAAAMQAFNPDSTWERVEQTEAPQVDE